MTKKKTAPVKKPMHKSLTVQSSIALAVLIVAKAMLPLYTGYEIPDELFQTLLAVLGVSTTYGLRRALPVVAACLIPMATIQCGPSVCEKVAIEIVNHPKLTSPPAGKVLIKCDGALKAELLGKKVSK